MSAYSTRQDMLKIGADFFISKGLVTVLYPGCLDAHTYALHLPSRPRGVNELSCVRSCRV